MEEENITNQQLSVSACFLLSLFYFQVHSHRASHKMQLMYRFKPVLCKTNAAQTHNLYSKCTLFYLSRTNLRIIALSRVLIFMAN